MVNLILNTYCNNNCPYCFAKKQVTLGTMGGNPSDEISIENVHKFIDFFKGEKFVGIMGGEPTLHPKFIDIVDLLIAEKFPMSIFTNGLYSRKISSYLVSINKRVKLVFNINKENLENSNKDVVLRNLSDLKSNDCTNMCLSLNYYTINQDMDYLIELANHFSIKQIRLGFSNPILSEDNEFLSIEQLKTQGDNIFNFFKKAIDANISISLDCGTFIPCMFSKSQLEDIYSFPQNLFSNCACNGVGPVDVGVNLDMWKCFPFSGTKTKNLSYFKDCSEMHSYLKDNFEYYYRRLYPQDICYDCEFAITDACTGGCLSRTISANKVRVSDMLNKHYLPHLKDLKDVGLNFQINNSLFKEFLLKNNHLGCDLIVSDILFSYDPFKRYDFPIGNYFPSEVRVFANFIDSKKFIDSQKFHLSRNVLQTDFLQHSVEIKRYKLGNTDNILDSNIDYDLKKESTHLVIYYDVYYNSKKIFSSLNDFVFLIPKKLFGSGQINIKVSSN